MGLEIPRCESTTTATRHVSSVVDVQDDVAVKTDKTMEGTAAVSAVLQVLVPLGLIAVLSIVIVVRGQQEHVPVQDIQGIPDEPPVEGGLLSESETQLESRSSENLESLPFDDAPKEDGT
jgi:hypothetical protein